MSIVVLKRKAANPLYSHQSSTPQEGFSIHGNRRNLSYIGRENRGRHLMRSTRAPDGTLRGGHGGCCGTFDVVEYGVPESNLIGHRSSQSAMDPQCAAAATLEESATIGIPLPVNWTYRSVMRRRARSCALPKPDDELSMTQEERNAYAASIKKNACNAAAMLRTQSSRTSTLRQQCQQLDSQEITQDIRDAVLAEETQRQLRMAEMSDIFKCCGASGPSEKLYLATADYQKPRQYESYREKQYSEIYNQCALQQLIDDLKTPNNLSRSMIICQRV